MIDQAFDRIVESKPCGKYFVVLMQDSPYYGGPEEGGWWGTDSVPVKYAVFPTLEEAEAAAERIRELADEMTAEAKREEGEHCLRQTQWLEERGLDDDYLSEPDGPSTYYVYVGDSVPTPHYGDRHYS